MTELHDKIIDALLECSSELQLTPERRRALKALTNFQSYADSGRRMGISGAAYKVKLNTVHRWLRAAIKRLADNQPLDEKRKKIDWSKFKTHAMVCLHSMELEYWKDIQGDYVLR